MKFVYFLLHIVLRIKVYLVHILAPRASSPESSKKEYKNSIFEATRSITSTYSSLPQRFCSCFFNLLNVFRWKACREFKCSNLNHQIHIYTLALLEVEKFAFLCEADEVLHLLSLLYIKNGRGTISRKHSLSFIFLIIISIRSLLQVSELSAKTLFRVFIF